MARLAAVWFAAGAKEYKYSIYLFRNKLCGTCRTAEAAAGSGGGNQSLLPPPQPQPPLTDQDVRGRPDQRGARAGNVPGRAGPVSRRGCLVRQGGLPPHRVPGAAGPVGGGLAGYRGAGCLVPRGARAGRLGARPGATRLLLPPRGGGRRLAAALVAAHRALQRPQLRPHAGGGGRDGGDRQRPAARHSGALLHSAPLETAGRLRRSGREHRRGGDQGRDRDREIGLINV